VAAPGRWAEQGSVQCNRRMQCTPCANQLRVIAVIVYSAYRVTWFVCHGRQIRSLMQRVRNFPSEL